MIYDRTQAFDTIKKSLAIICVDIRQRQSLNDLSLNIQGENFFRDVFNLVYGRNFVNANDLNQNTAYIDLIDERHKELIQITSTRSKEKILNTLKVFNNGAYKGYQLKIFYLLDKAMPNRNSVAEIESVYPNIKLKDILIDPDVLLGAIGALEENKLIEVYQRYFADKKKKYTDEMVLDMVYRTLLDQHKQISISYNDDLGSIDTLEKIKINRVNSRIEQQLLRSLDYTCIVEILDNGELGTELRELVVNTYYKEILLKQLKTKVNNVDILTKNITELQALAFEQTVDFSKLMYQLSETIQNKLLIKDFNSIDITWVLIAYFFELCDIGIKSHADAE